MATFNQFFLAESLGRTLEEIGEMSESESEAWLAYFEKKNKLMNGK